MLPSTRGEDQLSTVCEEVFEIRAESNIKYQNVLSRISIYIISGNLFSCQLQHSRVLRQKACDSCFLEESPSKQLFLHRPTQPRWLCLTALESLRFADLPIRVQGQRCRLFLFFFCFQKQHTWHMTGGDCHHYQWQAEMFDLPSHRSASSSLTLLPRCWDAHPFAKVTLRVAWGYSPPDWVAGSPSLFLIFSFYWLISIF